MAQLRRLSAREAEILDALTLRVRVLSIDQLARTWWSGSPHQTAHARRAVRALERDGLVRRSMLVAHPELLLTKPVISWSPGDMPPQLSAASRALKARWSQPPQLTTVVLATPAAANFFGGFARTDPKRAEQTHDLHVSTMFLHWMRLHPGLVHDWVSEAWIHQSRPDSAGERLPDAMVRRGTDHRVMEFGGAYGTPKLEEFHAFCARRRLPYEIW
jgi:hypothetical protein